MSTPLRLQKAQALTAAHSALELAAACDVQRMSFLLQSVVEQQNAGNQSLQPAAAELLTEENEKGETALIISARNGTQRMVALLLK
jgi:hypothetical protein